MKFWSKSRRTLKVRIDSQVLYVSSMTQYTPNYFFIMGVYEILRDVRNPRH